MKSKSLQKTAKIMRQKPTKAEKAFMDKLISWGIRFKFQFIIAGYIPDFYLPEYKLIVEIDGFSHYTTKGVLRDKFRTAILEKQGFKVLRIQNHAVYSINKEDLFNSIDGIITLKPQDTERNFFNSYMKQLSIF